MLELQADRRHAPPAARIEASDAATIGIDELWLWTLVLAVCGAVGGAGAWPAGAATGGRMSDVAGDCHRPIL